MIEKPKQERDQRALDALFVSQLRRHERCDQVDIDHLPRLTSADKEALDSLGPDFIGRLLAGNLPAIPHESNDEVDQDLLCAGGMSFGMNRGDDFDQHAAAEIERKRNEVIDRHRKNEGENDDSG